MFATTTNVIRHRRRVKSISTCLLAIPLTFLGGKSFINDNFLPIPDKHLMLQIAYFYQIMRKSMGGDEGTIFLYAMQLLYKFYSKNNMLIWHLCASCTFAMKLFSFTYSFIIVSMIRFILFFMIFLLNE